MSKLFDNLKSIFVVEGEGTKGKKKKQEEPEISQANDGAEEAPVVPTFEMEAVEGEVNQKFTDILLKAVEDNNQEGFDYIEYKRSLQNLFKMNLAEETTYKSAYAAAQTMGATPEGLVNSAQHYLQVLQREQEKFKSAIKNQRAKQIDGRMKEMEDLQAGISQKEARIKELEAEIQGDQEKLTQVEGAIQAAASKVEKTGSDFQASFTNLVAQIQGDIENIKKHLA